MKKYSTLKGIKLFINGTILFVMLGLLSSVFTSLFNPDFVSIHPIVNIIFTLALVSFLLVILVNLQKVIRTIENNNSFNVKNIVHFKRISYSAFGIGILDLIVKYPGHDGNFDLLATSYGSVKPSVFVYLLFGLFTLILTEIFKQAIENKNLSKN
ncbi:Protein of unknown function [Evansella caseinilytica]|uniref:DUF2975 family protein n=1 Tax=Evansella caseinilytica TaxID=1503961 RepID=A0A1H3GY07_9BACI|nr:DUF2975 domain-containing protein [Evansella caseinilytica]SDY07960.1 Protein of unknown function [Evansella caseinilytica]